MSNKSEGGVKPMAKKTKLRKWKGLRPDRTPPINVKIKCKVQLLWYEKHAALIINPTEWNSAMWMSRFHLAIEAMDKDDLSTASMGPVGEKGRDGKYHEEDWPIGMFDITLLPFAKPKKVRVLRSLRDRPIPREPRRKS